MRQPGVLSGTPAPGSGGSYAISFTAQNVVGTSATQPFTLTVNQGAAITSSNGATFAVGAAGSFTVMATGSPAPALSETGTLPNGVTFNASTGLLSGTPAAGAAGSYPITFMASNGVGTNATQNFTLTVNQVAAIISSNSVTFTVGAASNFTVTASGFPTPALSESGTLPSGVTFNSSTGILGGTPAGGTAGNYPVTFTAHNGVGGDATQNFTLTVSAAQQAPAITSASSTTFVAGTAGSFAVTTTGLPTPALSETGTLPTGVTFNAATGLLGGTPAASTGGTYFITFAAHNNVGTDATQNFTLAVNQAPAITSSNNTAFTVGAAGSFSLTATGFPVLTLSEIGTLPSGVTFNASTGTLTGTPAAGSAGSYPITLIAANGVGTNATQNFTLTVNQAPAITSSSSATFTASIAGSFTVAATGSPAPTLSESGTLPSGVTFNASTGVLGGTPAAGTSGSYPITFTASNGAGTNATQSFTLTIDQIALFTSSNSATFTVGIAGSFTVTATGAPAPTLSESGALPGGVTFNPATGVLGGTPAAGSTGSYPISFTAHNGVNNDATQSFTLTVSAAPQAPAFTSALTATFTVGTAGSFTVTATGSPTPTLSESGALPNGVTFTAATGALSGTPLAGSAGSYPITFTASNGVGANATQNFTLTVDQAPAITSSNSATFTVGAAGSFAVTATGSPAPSLSETGTLPAGVTFSTGTGLLSGTPAAGAAGSYPIAFIASNGIGANATQNFTLTVNQGATITSSNSATFTVGEAGSFTVTASGSPAPTVSETGTLPSGVTFNTSTGALGGTPATGTAGSYALTFTASNGVGTNGAQNFTLTVNQTAAITSSNSATFTVGTAGSFTVAAIGSPAPTLSESGTLPSGVTFNPGTGVLSGTPAAASGGAYPISFGAHNMEQVGSDTTQNFTLTVNQPAAITSSNSAAFTEGASQGFTVSATGFPAPALSESGPLPGGVSFNASTGMLSGTPAIGTSGSYPIFFTAHNGVGTDATQSFALTVSTAPQAPAITSASGASFVVGAAGSFAVTATGSPMPTLSETGALPGGVTFNTSTGVLSGAAAAGSAGSYPITFTASNGVGTNASQNFTLTINQGTAITSSNSATFTVGTAGSFTVTATGSPAPTLSETGTLPSGVTFNSMTGALSGTAAAGTAGNYPIAFTASNGVGTNAAQNFTLTVNQGAAITSPNSATFTAGTAGSFTVTAAGSPAPTLSEAGTLPSGVTFNTSTGALSGTPAAGTAGSYPITFTASNGVGTNAAQNFTLTVNQGTAITSSNNATFGGGYGGKLAAVTATGSPGADAERSGRAAERRDVQPIDGRAERDASGRDCGQLPGHVHHANGAGPNATQNFTLTINQGDRRLPVRVARRSWWARREVSP